MTELDELAADTAGNLFAALHFAAITHFQVDLKGAALLRLDLQVRYIGTLQRGNREVGHFGCGFVKLSAAQEHELQKFITNVQREERAKLG